MTIGPTTSRLVPDPTMADAEIGEATLHNLLTDAWNDGAEAGEGRYRRQLRQLEAVCRYVDALHGLIRWFDLAYGDNAPIWLTTNMYGQPLPANVELTETYRGVIGDK